MNLYIVRHGDPDYANDSLTPKGKEQAQRLVEHFKNIKIDKLFVSTHGRTIETAQPLIDKYNLIKIDAPWAREDIGAKYFMTIINKKPYWYVNAPKWKTLFLSEKMIRYGANWYKHPEIKKTPMAEGYRIMKESVDNFFKELGLIHDRKHRYYKVIKELPENVVIIAHGGFAISFISNLLDISYPLFAEYFGNIDCTAVTKIVFPNKKVSRPYIGYFNDINHLKD